MDWKSRSCASATAATVERAVPVRKARRERAEDGWRMGELLRRDMGLEFAAAGRFPAGKGGVSGSKLTAYWRQYAVVAASRAHGRISLSTIMDAFTEIEGTWEEVAARADELAGRRVRLTVLPEKKSAHGNRSRTS